MHVFMRLKICGSKIVNRAFNEYFVKDGDVKLGFLICMSIALYTRFHPISQKKKSMQL